MSVVAFDAGAVVATGGTSTASLVCTFTATSSAALIVCISVDLANITVSSCAVNGTAMTQYARVLNDANNMAASVFVLTACPSGVLSISANLVGAVATQMCIGGVTYTGARTANPFGGVTAFTAGAVVTGDISISSSANDMGFIFACARNNMTASNATTRLNNGAHHSFKVWDSSGTNAVNSTLSISASAVSTGSYHAWAAFNIVASATAATNITSYVMLTGVGI